MITDEEVGERGELVVGVVELEPGVVVAVGCACAEAGTLDSGALEPGAIGPDGFGTTVGADGEPLTEAGVV